MREGTNFFFVGKPESESSVGKLETKAAEIKKHEEGSSSYLGSAEK